MRILLAVNRSRFSDAATQALIAQAKPEETVVHVVHVIDVLSTELPEMEAYYPGIEHARDAQREIAEALVAKTAQLLRAKGLQVTTAVELGAPKVEIISAAAEWHADLIVLGSHGRTGIDRFLLGSLSDVVLRHAHCSVEIARIPRATGGSKRPGGLGKGKIKRILLTTDGSKFSEAALHFLMQQVWPHESEVRVLHVMEPLPLLAVRGMSSYRSILDSLREARTEKAKSLVNQIAETLRIKNLKVSTAIVRGDSKSKILDAAEQWNAELIVLGSLGRTGLERFLLGSVSDTVARHAHCSTEIVRIRPGG
ncbi:MAG: universal stress protein [Candidatus Acidiferrum sp.]